MSRTCDPEDVRVMIEDRDVECLLDGFGHSFSILMNFPFYPFFISFSLFRFLLNKQFLLYVKRSLTVREENIHGRRPKGLADVWW